MKKLPQILHFEHETQLRDELLNVNWVIPCNDQVIHIQQDNSNEILIVFNEEGIVNIGPVKSQTNK